MRLVPKTGGNVAGLPRGIVVQVLQADNDLAINLSSNNGLPRGIVVQVLYADDDLESWEARVIWLSIITIAVIK